MKKTCFGRRLLLSTNAYFSKFEQFLWVGSVILVILAYILFDRSNPLSLLASLIGVTSLIFCAKGNPIGQVLMIIFSLLYGFISYTVHYYGEMITYIGMTLPMATAVLISWLRHPHNGNHTEVQVYQAHRKHYIAVTLLTVLITVSFYYILRSLQTEQLFFSTLSIATSCFAASLTFLRSPYYALAYAVNDLILIVLWGIASLNNYVYLSVLICFITFFVLDLYGYFNWRRIQRRQQTQ